VDYESELYAERLRRKAQDEALAIGAVQWTEQLDTPTRVKLGLAWDDVTHSLPPDETEFLNAFIEGRTLRSIAVSLSPANMTGALANNTNERLLSLIEVEHEGLTALAEGQGFGGGFSSGQWGVALADLPDEFQHRVNHIFEAHIIGVHLHHNSRLVPVESHEMHDAVVVPMLYLLHSQSRFASAEAAYQKALKELRNRDPADAITDAATALQDVLAALGCVGNALGPLLKSAKSKGLLRGSDTPLTEAIGKTVDWVSATRGEGEAHTGNPNVDMSDAWMVVHVVGALIIRLSETNRPTEE
jgi:hypothetical protein